MVYGKDGNLGKAGNLESVSYGKARARQGSNPTLSAILSLLLSFS
jgi:hypothetical protein